MTDRELIGEARGASMNAIRRGAANEGDLYQALAERLEVLHAEHEKLKKESFAFAMEVLAIMPPAPPKGAEK